MLQQLVNKTVHYCKSSCAEWKEKKRKTPEPKRFQGFE